MEPIEAPPAATQLETQLESPEQVSASRSRGDRRVVPRSDRRAMQPQRAGAQLAFARVATALAMVATGALAVGAFAVGSLVIARLAIRQVAIARGRLGHVAIDELEVGRLVIHERLGLPRARRLRAA